MPEPFKNLFNETIIVGMGEHFAKAWPEFNQAAFVARAAKNLDDLKRKERSTQITEALTAFLPNDFERAATVLLASLASGDGTDMGAGVVNSQGIAGWAIMPMTHYAGLHGFGHFDLSMTLLREMTKRFSSEFGIRNIPDFNLQP